MATFISTYLFTIIFCFAGIYVDQNMQSRSLAYSFFDKAVSLLTHAPGILRALPSTVLRRMTVLYQEGVINLANDQKEIHKRTYYEALEEKRRYEKGLKILGTLDLDVHTAKAAEKELFLSVLEVVRMLRENIFLMDLIINHELEPEDKLADLLEDYYDGLLVEQRKDEEHFPWEEVKARLDAKHNLR